VLLVDEDVGHSALTCQVGQSLLDDIAVTLLVQLVGAELRTVLAENALCGLAVGAIRLAEHHWEQDVKSANLRMRHLSFLEARGERMLLTDGILVNQLLGLRLGCVHGCWGRSGKESAENKGHGSSKCFGKGAEAMTEYNRLRDVAAPCRDSA